MSRLPLRRSLLAGMVALTAVALLVAGVVSVAGLRSYLLDRTDDQLRAGAALATQRVGTLLREPGGTARAVVAPSDYLVEIRHPDGTLTRIGGSPPAVPLLDRAPAPPAGGAPGPATTLDDGAWRAITVRAGAAVVLIALPLAPVRETVRRLVRVEVAGGVTVLVLLAAFARVLLVRGLRPLDRITETATAIAGGDLDRRVPRHGGGGRGRRHGGPRAPGAGHHGPARPGQLVAARPAEPGHRAAAAGAGGLTARCPVR
ncbi:HAMP domain-containing protein [Micromonospora sp. WMMD980]|uniref:HAMP domain-containing protein n=1 Tax=Micromonospora sp. WMMD980 TaxID=3016088 RepID=UPI0024160D4A|nr:HAMP domain-containing protein [Micromonospora sp. WMMD980]MDG4800431.1 HAMP domain-containing protein [Micromonospora sp. WMMD980]